VASPFFIDTRGTSNLFFRVRHKLVTPATNGFSNAGEVFLSAVFITRAERETPARSDLISPNSSKLEAPRDFAAAADGGPSVHWCECEDAHGFSA
jgi:hypothetical protein